MTYNCYTVHHGDKILVNGHWYLVDHAFYQDECPGIPEGVSAWSENGTSCFFYYEEIEDLKLNWSF